MPRTRSPRKSIWKHFKRQRRAFRSSRLIPARRCTGLLMGQASLKGGAASFTSASLQGLAAWPGGSVEAASRGSACRLAGPRRSSNNQAKHVVLTVEGLRTRVRFPPPPPLPYPMMQDVKEKPKRALVAAVQLPSVSDVEFEASLTELRQLAKTLGFEVVGTFTQKRAEFDRRPTSAPASARSCACLAEDADVILVDHEISPSQARNLEKEVGCEVMDRTMVILEIFHRHARSRAARAQVEIARLGYMAPRMREAAKLAGPQGRGRSGVGGRGAGESRTRARPAQDPRPHRRAAEGARRDGRRAQDAARAAAGAPGARARGAGRLHQRGQVHPDARAHGQRGAGRRQALRDARHHRARAASRERAARARQRHGRLHQEPAARPGRLVQVDARRGARGLAAAARRRRERSRATSGSSR